MNIQTEHIENHRARFTVEIEPERLEKAKQATVRKLAQRVNIPGFRKGKAPYNMIVRYIGEPAILEETMETLGQEIYRETLDQAGIEPYGPGQLEDFKIDPNPTFVYTVPKQPTTSLGAYREVRVDYTEPTVTDEDVTRQIDLLLEQEAIVEESHRPVAIGNRVTVDIHSFFVEEKTDETEDSASGENAAEETTAETESPEAHEDHDEHDEHDHEHDEDGEHDHDEHDHGHSHHEDEGEPYVHQHDFVVRLVEGDSEPVGPGFSQALVGANLNEEREFTITYPVDDKISPEVAGRTVRFYVTVKKIEAMTLPVLNDEFAARFTERFAAPKPQESGLETPEQQPLTLLQLRMRIRELLQEDVKRASLDNYADQVLNEIVKGAEVSYPDAMLEDQIDSMLENVDQRLKQQGLSLEVFQRVTGKTLDEMRGEYQEQAAENLSRSLVLAELLATEKLTVSEDDLRNEMNTLAAQFGDQAAAIMQSLNTAQMRSSIVNRLLQERAFERIAAIGRGIAPDLESVEAAEASEQVESSEQTELTEQPETSAESVETSTEDGQNS